MENSSKKNGVWKLVAISLAIAIIGPIITYILMSTQQAGIKEGVTENARHISIIYERLVKIDEYAKENREYIREIKAKLGGKQ